jgi:hypothetical protein
VNKRPALYVVASALPRGKVVALRRAPRKPVAVAIAPRETSWRDLVRRLTRTPAKA